MKSFIAEAVAQVVPGALQAGIAVLDVYKGEVEVQEKADGSPLTTADLRSNEILLEHLSSILAEDGSPLPVLSEESRQIPYSLRQSWSLFWLVDPLDGSKEFLKRNGEFTINVGLVQGALPVGGVIYVPVLKLLYFSAAGCGAYRLALDEVDPDRWEGVSFSELAGLATRLDGQPATNRPFTIIGSRSHGSPEGPAFVEELKVEHPEARTISAGSSLKLCRVAEGEADIYPRLGPTSEWDTAAGHALVREVGKQVLVHKEEQELRYNKENLLNPWFVAR